MSSLDMSVLDAFEAELTRVAHLDPVAIAAEDRACRTQDHPRVLGGEPLTAPEMARYSARAFLMNEPKTGTELMSAALALQGEEAKC